MQKIDGFDYLYRNGDRYLIRMQVPTSLRAAVGRRELKAALGADFALACRNSHKVIADFDLIITRARAGGAVATAPAKLTLSRHGVDVAVHAYFTRMRDMMRGQTALANEDDLDPRSRSARIGQFETHINLMLDAVDRANFDMSAQSAKWLCEEHGWQIDVADDLFAYLCEGMLRGRLACYQLEVGFMRRGSAPLGEIDPFFAASSPKPVEPSLCLGDLIDKFNAERSAAWTVSTTKNYVIITRVIEEVCGRETPLASINKDFCRGVRDVLKQLPSNYQKKLATKGRPIKDVIQIAAEHKMPLLQPATINAHLNKFGAIVRFGRDEGWILGNPMAEIEVRDPVDAALKRDPFKVDHLQAIFGSEPWASRTERPDEKPSRFWVPLIALFTGARLGEICGIRTDEIVEMEGIAVIHIRHRSDRPVKGGRSRFIPVHSALAGLGFLAFVNEQRLRGTGMLFPECKPNSLEHWGDELSDWFGRRVKRLKLEGTKLTMHSFRHSFEDRLREADLHELPLGDALTGRRTGSVSRNYGSGFSTLKLVSAVESVRYPGLKLDHLLMQSAEPECASALLDLPT